MVTQKGRTISRTGKTSEPHQQDQLSTGYTTVKNGFLKLSQNQVLNDRLAFGRRKYFNMTNRKWFTEEPEVYVDNFYYSSNQMDSIPLKMHYLCGDDIENFEIVNGTVGSVTFSSICRIPYYKGPPYLKKLPNYTPKNKKEAATIFRKYREKETIK